MPFNLLKTFAVCAIVGISAMPDSAQAGPLLDWLFGRNTAPPAYPVGQPVAVGNAYASGYGSYPVPPAQYSASYGSYYGSQMPVIGPSGAGYVTPPPTGAVAATMPATLSFVPNYRTRSYRAPVTYYRPVMTTDPNTGAQVVAMSPCTSYEYQTQRVPTVGRRALFGSNLMPQVLPAPRTVPTYTLPSGGVPLAGNASSYNLAPQYSAAYGRYSSYSPYGGTTVTGNYPTRSSYYAGSAPSGGCTGSYVTPTSPVPGLSAPQAPGRIITPAPTYGQPTTPPGTNTSPSVDGYGVPPYGTGGGSGDAGGVYPSDPAGDAAPTLPSEFPSSAQNSGASQFQNMVGHSTNRPALRSTLPIEPAGQFESAGQSLRRVSPFTEAPVPERSASQPAGLDDQHGRPIPVPESLKLQPRWNPGLLREDDMTAQRPFADRVASYSGQGTKIHWAKFENASSASNESTARNDTVRPGLRTFDDTGINGASEISSTPSRYFSRGWRSSN